jgi:hypothetical protein
MIPNKRGAIINVLRHPRELEDSNEIVGEIFCGRDTPMKFTEIKGDYAKLSYDEYELLRNSANFKEHDPDTEGWCPIRMNGNELLLKMVVNAGEGGKRLYRVMVNDAKIRQGVYLYTPESGTLSKGDIIESDERQDQVLLNGISVTRVHLADGRGWASMWYADEERGTVLEEIDISVDQLYRLTVDGKYLTSSGDDNKSVSLSPDYVSNSSDFGWQILLKEGTTDQVILWTPHTSRTDGVYLHYQSKLEGGAGAERAEGEFLDSLSASEPAVYTIMGPPTLPLHIGIKRGFPPDINMKILNMYPDAVMKADEYGGLILAYYIIFI